METKNIRIVANHATIWGKPFDSVQIIRNRINTLRIQGLVIPEITRARYVKRGVLDCIVLLTHLPQDVPIIVLGLEWEGKAGEPISLV